MSLFIQALMSEWNPEQIHVLGYCSRNMAASLQADTSLLLADVNTTVCNFLWLYITKSIHMLLLIHFMSIDPRKCYTRTPSLLFGFRFCRRYQHTVYLHQYLFLVFQYWSNHIRYTKGMCYINDKQITEGDGSKQQLGPNKRTEERFWAFSGSMTNFYFSTKSYTQGKRHWYERRENSMIWMYTGICSKMASGHFKSQRIEFVVVVPML